MAFIVDNIEVGFQDIFALKSLSGTSPFLIEVINFLESWYDSSDSVEVSTSGSTGPPKTISLTKVAMQASAGKTARFFNFKPGQTALLAMSSKYIAGKMMLVRAIVSDLELYLVKPSSKPLRGIQASIDFLPMTPHQLMTTWNDNPESLSKVKTILLGGGPIYSDHAKIVSQLSSQVYHGFGMTETITHIAVRSLTQQSLFYMPLDGITIRVGDRGQLIIEGDHLEEAVITNDLVEVNPDQSFRWLGRLDNVINSGGVKLYPELIESKLKPYMGDSLFFIHKEPDTTLGEKVILVLESTDNQKLSDLDYSIASVLDKYERPREIYTLKSFIFTETGKINRKATFENK